jgi:hypothetical protein
MEAVDAQEPPAERTDEVERIAAAVYGLIVAASVMTAGADHSTQAIFGAVVVTVVVYWLAETYARYLAERTMSGRDEAYAAARHHALHHWRMVTAPFVPLAVLAVAGWLGFASRGAVLSALVVTTGMLAFAGLVAGRRAGMSRLSALVTAGVAGLAGLVMIALKLALH